MSARTPRRSENTSQADWDRHYADQEDPYGYAEHRAERILGRLLP